MVRPTSDPVRVGAAYGDYTVRLTDRQVRLIVEMLDAQPHDPTNRELNALRAQLMRLSHVTA